MALAPTAEIAYLFRHALLRDASYELQVPTDRARLHALAYQVMDALFGEDGAAAHEMAVHAQCAGDHHAEAVCRRHAGDFARRGYRNADAVSEFARLAEIPGVPADEVARALADQATVLQETGRLNDAVRVARASVEIACAPAARADAWRVLAMCERFSSGPAVAMEAARKALELYGRCESARGQARALTEIAIAQHTLGNVAEAEISYREALAIHAALGDQMARGSVLGNMAVLLLDTSRHAEAEGMLREALELHRRAGSRKGEAKALANLGVLHANLDHYAPAEEYYRLACAMYGEVGDMGNLAGATSNLANVLRDTGRDADAMQLYQFALELQRSQGIRRGEAITRANLGGLLRKVGQFEPAQTQIMAALAIHRAMNNRRFEGSALSNLGDVKRAMGRLDEAEKAYADALAILTEVNDELYAASAAISLARVRRLSGRLDSHALLLAALRTFRARASRTDEAETLTELGHLAQARAEPAQAHFEAAAAIHDELGRPQDAARLREAAGNRQG